MGLKRTNEFRQDAVRIALTSGLKRKQVDKLLLWLEVVATGGVKLVCNP